jgi:O-antigen ligase
MKTLRFQPMLILLAGIILLGSIALFVAQDEWLWLFVPTVFLLALFAIHKPEWVFYTLIASLPFSIEYFFPSGFSTDIPGEPLMLFTGFFAILAIAVKSQWKHSPGTVHPVALLLCGWFLWVGFTALLSTDRFLSLKYFAAKAWYIAAFVLPFIAWGNDNIVRRTMKILLTAMFLAVVFVLWNHAQSSFRFATVNEAVRPFFRNHVNYSAMLVCLVPVAWLVYRDLKERRWKAILLFIMAVILFALVVAYARGAWLALAAGILAYWLMEKRKIIVSFVFSIVLTIAALAWLKSGDRYLQLAPNFQKTIFHENFGEHLVATYKLKDLSSAERLYRWIAGIRMATERPLTGTGPNSFYPAYKSYTIPLYKTWVSDNPEKSGVHNYFLLLAIEQGLPGLLLFLLLVGSVLYFLQKGYHQYQNAFHRELARMGGVMMVMILVLNFLSDLIETDKVGSLFFIVLGLALYLDKQDKLPAKLPN